MTESTVGFYVIGGTLQETAGSYVTRRADDELFTGLKAGEFCYVLTSRQMGKSSLMIRTSRRLQAEGVTTVILDLTRLGQNLSAEQWYLGLLNLVGERIGIEDELEDYWFAEKNKGPWVKWSTALRDIVMKKVPGPLVLLVDEIDVVRSLPFSTDEFFAGIREFYNRRTQDPDLHRLSFALFGVATPSDLIRDTRLTPFNIGKRIELTDFTENEARPLASGLGNGTGEKLLRRVLHWTGGHPYLTQRLCREVAQNLPLHSGKDVDRLCRELFLSPQARVQDDNLLFVRERLLRSEVELAGLLDLYGQVRRGKTPPDEENNPIIGVLKLSGIVRPVNGRLVGRNRIYEEVFDSEWVELNMPEAELRRQKAALRKGRLQVATAALVVLLVMGILSTVALVQRNRAVTSERNLQAQTRRIEETQASLLFQRGIKEAFEGNQMRAACWLNEAYRFRMERNLGDLTSLRFVLGETMKAFDAQRMTLRGHTDMINGVTFTPDGRRIVTCGEDPAVRFWDSRTGRELKRFEGHSKGVKSVAVSPDGRFIATGSRDLTIRLLDAATGAELKQFQGHTNTVHTVAFSPDGKHLVSTSWDKTARIWNVETGSLEKTLVGHSGRVYPACYSPDGKRIATGSADQTCIIWDAASGAQLTKLEGHTDFILAVAFSPDGRRIVSGSFDQTAKLWDATSGVLLGQLFGTGEMFECAAFSPDGKKIATGGADKVVRVWNARTGVEIERFEGHASGINAVAFSPDGKVLASSSTDKTTRLWNLGKSEASTRLEGHQGWIQAIAFSPDGERIVSGSRDLTARVWELGGASQSLTLNSKGIFFACAFSPDGRWIAAGGDNDVKLWDARTGKELRQFPGEGKSNLGIAFSPDGKLLATCGSDGSAALWDVETGRIAKKLEGHSEMVLCIRFSPDGHTVVTGGADRTTRLWDVATSRELKRFEGHLDSVYSVAFSPDGQRLATGSGDLTARVWNISTGAEMTRLEGHSGPIQTVAFSPDGRLIATGGKDKYVSLWESETGIEVFRLKGYESTIKSLAFSPDGTRLATGGDDRDVRIWNLVPEKRSPEEIGTVIELQGPFRFYQGRVILK
jgi:WD40 repeat protein